MLKHIKNLKRFIGLGLWRRSYEIHKTTMDRKTAPLYTKYLASAKATARFKAFNPQIQKLAEDFNINGFNYFWAPESEEIAKSILTQLKELEKNNPSIWNLDGRAEIENIFETFPELLRLFKGDLSGFLKCVYGSHFKIFYGITYKSIRVKEFPEGSQLWHSDGGPGTCINLMFCLSEVNEENGAMECLPWKESFFIQSQIEKEMQDLSFTGMERTSFRAIKSQKIKKIIESSYADKVVQPQGGPGMLLAFRNNLLHKGGFPEWSKDRYVIVFHIYPSIKEKSMEEYLLTGIAKPGPYPKDPSFGD